MLVVPSGWIPIGDCYAADPSAQTPDNAGKQDNKMMREAYRLQKQPLLKELQNKQIHCIVFFIYTGNQLPKSYDINQVLGEYWSGYGKKWWMAR